MQPGSVTLSRGGVRAIARLIVRSLHVYAHMCNPPGGLSRGTDDFQLAARRSKIIAARFKGELVARGLQLKKPEISAHGSRTRDILRSSSQDPRFAEGRCVGPDHPPSLIDQRVYSCGLFGEPVVLSVSQLLCEPITSFGGPPRPNRTGSFRATDRFISRYRGSPLIQPTRRSPSISRKPGYDLEGEPDGGRARSQVVFGGFCRAHLPIRCFAKNSNGALGSDVWKCVMR